MRDFDWIGTQIPVGWCLRERFRVGYRTIPGNDRSSQERCRSRVGASP